MTKLPKHLQEKLEQIKDPSLHFQCGDYTCVAHKSFKEGAAAMHSLMLEEMKPIVEALEKYSNPQNWRYKQNNDVGAFDAWLDFKPGHYSKTHKDLGIYLAKQALEHYREKIGGVK